MPGHDFGHTRGTAPEGLSWQGYVEHFIGECGGLTALADRLIERARGQVEIPEDLGSVERGLRRLGKRERKDGGQYGRWMLRFFGMPQAIAEQARELGQYHSRLADLPSSQRLAQLRAWNRPPVADSPLAPWIELGLASVMLRKDDREACELHLERALPKVDALGVDARLEADLLRARLATGRGKRNEAAQILIDCEKLCRDETLSTFDRLCYRARVVDQQGFHLTTRGDPDSMRAARDLYAALPEELAAPFACFRRRSGLVYATWQLGDVEAAVCHARAAADFAGDGGLVRFRVMALSMLGMIADDEVEAEAAFDRARRLAQSLEDDDLLVRIERRQDRRARERA